MATQSDVNELIELCGKVRDGIVHPQEVLRLEQRLLGESESLRFYRRFMSVCSGLEQIAQTETAESFSRIPSWPIAIPTKVETGTIRRPAISIYLTASAIAVAAALLVIVSWMSLNGGNSSENQLAATIQEHGAVWNVDGAPTGSKFQVGKYVLKSGASKLQFANQAELLIQAPTVFSIDSPTQATLHSGCLTLVVPPSAKGFRVETPFGSVIDRGTRIGVLSNENDGMEVHVFEGKAQLLPARTSQAETLSAGEAASVLQKDGTESSLTITRSVANQSYFAESIEKLSLLPNVSGDINLLVAPPRSVRRIQSELVDKGRASLFLERSGLRLTSDLAVSDASQSHSVLDQKQVLAKNTQVDVYMVHLTVPRNQRRSDRRLVVEGVIRFAQPVLGVLVNEPGKFGHLLGNPTTDYPGDKLTGLENDVDGNVQLGDRVTLSEDRRTLTLHLEVHGREAAKQEDFIDQLRIFIQSN
jgi:hypothetical protein